MKAFKLIELKSALKTLLKKRGWTYQDLASELDCSVPTVKRMLGQEELTVTRLLELCDLLDVSLSELELLTETKTEGDARFTPEQDKFLAKNSGHFAYLMELFKGESPKAIAARFNLTTRSTDKYLIALEKQGLIRVTGKLRVKPALKELPKLGNGPLGRQYYRAIIDASAKFFASEIDDELRKTTEGKKLEKSFGVMALKVTERTYKEWTERMSQEISELERRANFEEKSHPASELKSMVVLRANTLVENEERVRILDGIFGAIPNLS